MSAPLYVVRELKTRRAKGPPAVSGPDDVVSLLGGLAEGDREQFVVLNLNTRHEPIRRETVSVGSLNASVVHPREVFRAAIRDGAAAIIVAHNHPSGDPEPSEEDLAMTRRLKEAGQILGIPLLDHVVVARRGAVSLAQRGRL